MREDREAQEAPARKQAEAAAQAHALAIHRHELGERLEQEAAAIHRLLSEYVSVSQRHIEARDEAGFRTDEGRNVTDLLDEWFAQRFRDYVFIVRESNSPGQQDITRIGQPDLPLFELDPLASPEGDMDGAA